MTNLSNLIDVNVYLSRWPLARLPADEPEELVARLGEHRIAQAWAGSFDGLLHRDVAGVNLRLTEDCKTYGNGQLIPFGTVNPMLPDWEEDVRRCAVEHQMPGIRLHPNYHGYELSDPVFVQLLELADEHGLLVQIVATMEDERMQHPLLRVPHVDLTPLPEALETVPRLSVVVLNAFRSRTIDQAAELAAKANVYFDIAMLEGLAGVERLLEKVAVDRVLFGSHAPLFAVESALGKLRESSPGGRALEAICRDNARRLFNA